MEAWHHDDRATIYHGDCIEVLRTLPDASVDSVVTDPPYGLGFMGKEWDKGRMLGQMATGNETRGAYAYGGSHDRGYADHDADGFQVWCHQWAAEALRVLKPGGHLLAFGGTRTWHRLAVAVEDAGFEVRDSIAWLYGSGFPKSLDVSKAIDKAAGAEREKVRHAPRPASSGTMAGSTDSRPWIEKSREVGYHEVDGDIPATPDAARWSGWGTALKPAFEPVVVARKPLTGTVAANVLEHGVGGLNIDGCRVATDDKLQSLDGSFSFAGSGGANETGKTIVKRDAGLGRWPANVVLDEDQAEVLDGQSGVRSSPPTYVRSVRSDTGIYNGGLGTKKAGDVAQNYGDSGGASRFFYVAKAPAKERPKVDGVAHPTVKPLSLMRWLCRLVTPPGGVILEPFAGSGTTIEAALMEGFRVVAIEREDDYLPLIAARLERVSQEPDDGQLTLDASA